MSKEVLKTGLFTYNSVEYGVTSLSLEKNATEVDVTDTKTTGDEKEYLAGRIERPFTIEMWKDVSQADPPHNELYAGEIDFEGFTYAGDMILLKIKVDAQIDNAVKLTVEGRFSGTVVETPVA